MYESTRGLAKEAGFEKVLLSGYCSDEGLFVPKSLPKVDLETLRTWSKLDFPNLTKQILPFFIPKEEIPVHQLSELVDKAFSRFSNKNIVQLADLKNNLRILELFHGPTLAFKDISMVCVGQLLEFFLSRRQEHSVILIGTSGDTGSSAIEALRGLECVDVIVLLPKGRISETQELQMTTVTDENVHVFRVDGNSDELDEPIRRCFSDADFVAENNLSSLNSLNWGRVMVQIVNFFYAYFKVCPSCDEEVEIVIPTGACGHTAAGCYAHQMGLPIKLVCTVSGNEVLDRFITTGVYSVEGPLITSLAPAMDIQIAYNVERMLWLFSNGDSTVVRKIMEEFEGKRHVEIPAHIHKKMKDLIRSHRVDDVGILSAIRRCWTENDYIVCPHTATAVHYHYDHLPPPSKSRGEELRICLATASPAKFKEAVIAAGLDPVTNPQIESLKSKPTKYQDMEKNEDWNEILKQHITKITRKRTNSHQ